MCMCMCCFEYDTIYWQIDHASREPNFVTHALTKAAFRQVTDVAWYI